ncbi:MAG: UbiA family prenyltransferase [Candidatus Aenigmarchaeota archaeon]|nr:UbiA family prenyltransferase [Candidatus Aenigmarchaeota archaeon]
MIMLSYLTILRPLNGLMSVLAVVIGSGIVTGGLSFSIPLLLGALSVFLISGGGMIVNDIFDIEIDKINKPQRPLPSGKITKKIASIYAAVLFLAGLGCAALINQHALIIAVVASVLLIGYAAQMKKMLVVGHVVVSAMVAITFLFGAVIVGDPLRALPVALLAFLSNMGREIFKTIDDILGDSQAGVDSLPVKIGVIKSRWVAATFLFLAVLISPIPYIYGLFNEVYLFIVIIADILFLLAAILSIKYASKLTKLGMSISLLAFVAGLGLHI